MASLNNLVIGLLRYAGYTNLAHARRLLASKVRAALKFLTTHPRRLKESPAPAAELVDKAKR
jgi:hypothetical protein